MIRCCLEIIKRERPSRKQRFHVLPAVIDCIVVTWNSIFTNYMLLANFLNIKFSFYFDRSCLSNVTELKCNCYNLRTLRSVRNRTMFVVVNKPFSDEGGGPF